MQADFSILPDPEGSTVRIAMSGFFTEADVQRFAAARDAVYRPLSGGGGGGHRTLVDIRGMNIQSQASVDAFARLLGDRAHASRRLAFVVEAGLARAQIHRAAAGRDAAFFLSLDEAETWLSEEDAPPRSGARARMEENA